VAASQAMKTLLNFTFGSGAKIEELAYGDNEEIRIGLERNLLKKFNTECN
jgi:hypothetical protein